MPKQKKNKVPLMLPTPHLQAIGNLAAHWAYLETVTEYVIWAELDLPRERGLALTTHMGMVTRAQLIVMLLHNRLTRELCAPMERLLARIDQARVRRNEIVHAFWKRQKSGPSAMFHRVSAKGRIKERTESLTALEIRSVAYEIWELVRELMSLLEGMYPERPFPWRRKSPPKDGG